MAAMVLTVVCLWNVTALDLETFEQINLEDEDSLVLVDAEVMAWLEKERLSDYASQIARYGGTLELLMRRITSSVIGRSMLAQAHKRTRARTHSTACLPG
jgi:hypothetical protein